MKGKDMILSDFYQDKHMTLVLSRQTTDNSDPHDIIPISFNMHGTLHEKYYNIETNEKYLVQIHSQTKSS